MREENQSNMSEETKPAAPPPERRTIHCPHCQGHAVSLVHVVGVGVEIQCAAPLCQKVVQAANTLAGLVMGKGVVA